MIRRISDTPPVPRSLYARLGPGPVAMLATDWTDRCLADDRLYPWWHRAGPMARCRARAYHGSYLAELLGGPPGHGGDLGEAHTELRITTDVFAFVCDHLRDALRYADVPELDVVRVLARMQATHTQIVTAAVPGHGRPSGRR